VTGSKGVLEVDVLKLHRGLAALAVEYKPYLARI